MKAFLQTALKKNGLIRIHSWKPVPIIARILMNESTVYLEIDDHSQPLESDSASRCTPPLSPADNN